MLPPIDVAPWFSPRTFAAGQENLVPRYDRLGRGRTPPGPRIPGIGNGGMGPSLTATARHAERIESARTAPAARCWPTLIVSPFVRAGSVANNGYALIGQFLKPFEDENLMPVLLAGGFVIALIFTVTAGASVPDQPGESAWQHFHPLHSSSTDRTPK